MLIAEMGNNHFGDFNLAKEIIRVAKECGADAVKGQAFLPKDFNSGSMPKEFYDDVSMCFEEYFDLIDYGRQIKIPVFFSILSKELADLVHEQRYTKVTASQWESRSWPFYWYDDPATLISIRRGSRFPDVKLANVLYASDYVDGAYDLKHLEDMRNFYTRPIGLSDHNINIDYLLTVMKYQDIHIIEKHFTLKKHLSWKGFTFRDTIHGADPTELERIAKSFGR